MHLTNNGAGWPQSLIRDPLPEYPATCELAQQLGPGESDYTEYDRNITNATCDWLRQHASKANANPWVLFVSFVSPHYPLIAPEAFYRLYRNADFDDCTAPQPYPKPIEHPVLREIRHFYNYDDYFTDESRSEARKNYFGLISFLDHNIGQVLQTLDDCGSTSDTLILYLSDHGEMLGHLGFWTKSVMYEDSAGIPMLAAGGGFKAGRCRAPVSLTNIHNTVLEAIGVGHAAPKFCLEESLQSIVATPDVPRFTFSEYHDGGTPQGFFMLRENNWKLVHYMGGFRPQLFDLENDPWEINDLADHKEHLRRQQSLQDRLFEVLDPDQVMECYTCDQIQRIAELGGRERILALNEFGHTPVQ